MDHSASEQFYRICLTTHHTITSMDFFADLFAIASTSPEAEPPSTPVDAGSGTGGCVIA